jgi:hypothetical protein
VAGVEWDDAALYDLLHSIDGPVGRWLSEKVGEMTAIAEATAPIQKQKNWSWGKDSTSYLPRSLGYLKGSVRPHIGYTVHGDLFGGTDAAYGPTLFLEEGGGRYGHAQRIPFLSEALYAAIADL